MEDNFQTLTFVSIHLIFVIIFIIVSNWLVILGKIHGPTSLNTDVIIKAKFTDVLTD